MEDWFTDAFLDALSIYDMDAWLQKLNIDIDREKLSPQVDALNHFYATLSFLDSLNLKATLFIQGKLAQRYPMIVKEAMNRGHEIASHGYNHIPLPFMSPVQFRSDLELSLKILEDIGSIKIKGYRAPDFSLTPSTQWAWEIMEEMGLEYSSSTSPNKFPHLHKPTRVGSGRLIEFPLITLSGLKVSGGRFARFLPIWAFRKFLLNLNKKALPFLFYFHSYELAKKLRINTNCLPISLRIKFVPYIFAFNFRLNRVPWVVSKLSKEFKFAPLIKVLQNLNL